MARMSAPFGAAIGMLDDFLDEFVRDMELNGELLSSESVSKEQNDPAITATHFRIGTIHISLCL